MLAPRICGMGDSVRLGESARGVVAGDLNRVGVTGVLMLLDLDW